MLECVANVSEGRRRDAIERIGAACPQCLLDVHVDADHNRSVFTMVADDSDEIERCAAQLAHAVARYADDTWHDGVHPRIGALDVVPFVALSGTADERAIAAHTAHDFAQWLAGTLDVPTFLYGDADPAGRSLPSIRRDAFVRRAPDFGPGEPHPELGATAVGARPELVAVNCVLDDEDVELASRIAHDVRERGGGLPGVRALGFELASRRRAQVSMNLTELAATGIEQACTEVRRLARGAGTSVAGVELVGLLPRAEFERCSPEFRRWAGLSDDVTIEGRLDSHPLGRRPGA
ncbi:MAG TPA: glutamate formiminotransferase [Acidimicrobiia bacterium]|nr:glutamate formiminotransferase [Acidimicrobiia bacterium]